MSQLNFLHHLLVEVLQQDLTQLQEKFYTRLIVSALLQTSEQQLAFISFDVSFPATH